MTQPSPVELIERIRRGDEEAVRQFLAEYQGVVEREVRFALLDRRMRRIVGDSDVKQSVVMKFVIGLWSGKYEFESPQQIIALLKTMVRARVADLARHWRADKRDVRKEAALSDIGAAAPAGDRSPSEIVGERELLQLVAAKLDDEERSILRLRQEGRSWHELAASLGTKRTPEALRKKYERSLNRISKDLGLGDDE